MLDSYERASQEEKYSSSSKRAAGPEKRAVIALCKENCVSHCALVLSEVEYFDPTYKAPSNM